MGQFKNRPDFAVEARLLALAGDEVLENEALYVGGAGDVVVVPIGQAGSVTFVGVPAGTFLPVACSEVKLTGTTATSILALK